MKHILASLMLCVPSIAFAQTYACTPVKGCFLTEGSCDIELRDELPVIFEFSETNIIISPENRKTKIVDIHGTFSKPGESSFFGSSSEGQMMLTLFESGTMILTSIDTDRAPTGAVVEATCEGE